MHLLQMMNRSENQLSEVYFNLEYSLFFYLLESPKILYVVVMEVIQVGINVFGLGDISFTELLRDGMFYRWVWHLCGLWYLIIMKLRMVFLLLYRDGIDTHEYSSLNLLVSIH